MKGFILLLARNESYLVKKGVKQLHTKSGVIKLEEPLTFGKIVKSHLGKEFVIVEPTFLDVMNKKYKRLPQVVLPKDVATILAYTGVRRDARVVDAGTGSGYMATFLAYYLNKGKVYTYEIRKDFYEVAKKNFELLALDNVEIKNKDVTEGIDEENVDLVTLDLKDVERVLPNAYESLKPGGWLVVYSPYVEQMLNVAKALKKLNFTKPFSLEVVVREWRHEKHSRPVTTGLMHTGFLTFARKLK